MSTRKKVVEIDVNGLNFQTETGHVRMTIRIEPGEDAPPSRAHPSPRASCRDSPTSASRR